MEQIVNIPPSKTFGWLGVNGTRTDVPPELPVREDAVEAGQSADVLLRGSGSYTAAVGENAVLRLTLLGDGVNRVNVTCAAGARFELYRAVLGGADTFDDISVSLAGDGSAFTSAVGYRLTDGQTLDGNYVSVHTGRNTKTDMLFSGVLARSARKLVRATIDLRRGCKGAEGSELEDVLLMDDTVRNQTVPVILCDEEDVEGSHGATIGRPDEQTAFYLSSRGLPPEDVEELLAKSKLDVVLRRIPDAAVRAELLGEAEE